MCFSFFFSLKLAEVTFELESFCFKSHWLFGWPYESKGVMRLPLILWLKLEYNALINIG